MTEILSYSLPFLCGSCRSRCFTRFGSLLSFWDWCGIFFMGVQGVMGLSVGAGRSGYSVITVDFWIVLVFMFMIAVIVLIVLNVSFGDHEVGCNDFVLVGARLGDMTRVQTPVHRHLMQGCSVQLSCVREVYCCDGRGGSRRSRRLWLWRGLYGDIGGRIVLAQHAVEDVEELPRWLEHFVPSLTDHHFVQDAFVAVSDVSPFLHHLRTGHPISRADFGPPRIDSETIRSSQEKPIEKRVARR